MKITDKLPLVTAEPTRMLQLFQNLITNAVKYIDKPRGVIEIGCTFESDFCKFCVRDNGIGIDKKHSERIFQIFQKLVPDDDPQSTGIGLTIAKKIVELYGGKIWFESPPDSGTSFYFTFPLGIVSEKQTEKGSKKIPQSVFRKEL
jgi:signal transduction histidine kinase